MVPIIKEDIEKRKQAWISYDTLYVNGRPVNGQNKTTLGSVEERLKVTGLTTIEREDTDFVNRLAANYIYIYFCMEHG